MVPRSSSPTGPIWAPSPFSILMTTIELLDPKVRNASGKRGFSDLSEAQQQAIPLALSGKHIVLIAPTGTGKTESGMFPVFNALLQMPAVGGSKRSTSRPSAPSTGIFSPGPVVERRTRAHRRGPPWGYPAWRAAEAGPLATRSPDHNAGDPAGALHGEATAEAPRKCTGRHYR